MNRKFTNVIRFFMDECLPPIIRDSRLLMSPLIRIWFRGKLVNEILHFKEDVWKMTDREFEEFYERIETISKERKTDLTQESLQYLKSMIPRNASSLLDVGCGNGAFLEALSDLPLRKVGLDVFPSRSIAGAEYVRGNAERLPFADKSFDVVSCNHVLEHVRDFGKVINELKRVARHALLLTVPMQRPYQYTLDLHIRFFQTVDEFERAVGIVGTQSKAIWGDVVSYCPVGSPTLQPQDPLVEPTYALSS